MRRELDEKSRGKQSPDPIEEGQGAGDSLSIDETKYVCLLSLLLTHDSATLSHPYVLIAIAVIVSYYHSVELITITVSGSSWEVLNAYYNKYSRLY